MQDVHPACLSQELSWQTAKLSMGRPVHENLFSILHKGLQLTWTHIHSVFSLVLCIYGQQVRCFGLSNHVLRSPSWKYQMLLSRLCRAELYLSGCIHMQVVIVGDELHGGVPDVLGGELASPLNERNHDVCVPLQVREESATRSLQRFVISSPQS